MNMDNCAIKIYLSFFLYTGGLLIKTPKKRKTTTKTQNGCRNHWQGSNPKGSIE